MVSDSVGSSCITSDVVCIASSVHTELLQHLNNVSWQISTDY